MEERRGRGERVSGCVGCGGEPLEAVAAVHGQRGWGLPVACRGDQPFPRGWLLIEGSSAPRRKRGPSHCLADSLSSVDSSSPAQQWPHKHGHCSPPWSPSTGHSCVSMVILTQATLSLGAGHPHLALCPPSMWPGQVLWACS